VSGGVSLCLTFQEILVNILRSRWRDFSASAEVKALLTFSNLEKGKD
jgi:hypothetical protein